MRILLLFLSLCGAVLSLCAQNTETTIYESTLVLTNKIKSHQQKKLALDEDNLLQLNHHYQGNNTSEAAKVNNWRGNPFIGPYLGERSNKKAEEEKFFDDLDNYVNNKNDRSPREANTSVLGLDFPPAAIIAGLSDFLVKRTKTELGLAFFQGFKERVEKSVELQTLFPASARTLMAIDQEIYNFNAYWEILQESFRSDMDQLFINTESYIIQTPHIKNEDLRPLLADFFRVVYLMRESTPAPDLIHYLGYEARMQQREFENDSLQHFKQQMELLALFSQALRNAPSEANYWITGKQFHTIWKDSIATHIFLGLIYERGKHIPLANGKTLGEVLNRTKSKAVMEQLRNLQERAILVQTQANDLRAKPTTTTTRDTLRATDRWLGYYQLNRYTLDLLEYGYLVSNSLLDLPLARRDSIVVHYVRILRDVNELFWDIHQKRYASSIARVLFILEAILPDDRCQCLQTELLRYGTFIATTSQAQSSQEVSAAIEAFALPPGSSSLKKNAAFSISLNAYVGLAGGQEMLQGQSPRWFQAVGTPLGMSFNWGFKRAGSLSAMLSVIDVGAVTAYRFRDSTNSSSALTDLRWENVFAPGAYLVYGLPKWPISLGFGGQLGPHLRAVGSNNTFQRTNGWRWGAFIGVDIPLTHFYTSEQKLKRCIR